MLFKKKSNDNFQFPIEDWFIDELGLKGTELLIYAVVFSVMDYGFTRPYSALAEMVGVSEGTVKKVVKDLMDRKILQFEFRTKKTKKQKRKIRAITCNFKVLKPWIPVDENGNAFICDENKNWLKGVDLSGEEKEYLL
ncbi:MAG: hypothetical protein LUF26_06085 [Firmicutes bacterium]|nr:hypothetical protein [Bacillota bacterium]